jgi:GntR family transcriptional regulator
MKKLERKGFEMLNKNDSIPLYIQLKQLLRKKILDNELKEMDFLPSESQLMEKFQITRTTIRKAISELKQEGLVQQVQGKGVYVKTRELKETVWNFQSFSDLVMRYSKEPVTRLLEKEEVFIIKINFKISTFTWI